MKASLAKTTILLLFFIFSASFAGSTETAAQPENTTQNRHRELTGSWKLVRATITPDVLGIPVPVHGFTARGVISTDSTCTIHASGSFLGKEYSYSGNGRIEETDGATLVFTVDKGIIVRDGTQHHDRPGSRIHASYRVTADDTLIIMTFRDADGIRYRFDLELSLSG